MSQKKDTIKIAIFASGSGTNAENIIQTFLSNHRLEVQLIISNNPNAGVIERAKSLNIPIKVVNKEEFSNKGYILNLLESFEIDFLILAGFLWLIPEFLIDAFPKKIINIHPALLPNYGGKGMYGLHVHKAVLKNKDAESGITIHFVNQHYDEGEIIAQHKLKVNPLWSPEELQAAVHKLEYEFYPKEIAGILEKTN